MSSQSSISSLELDDPQQRLQQLWKSIKRTRNIESFVPSKPHSQSKKIYMDSPGPETRPNIFHQQNQLQQMKQNTVMLVSQLNRAQKQIQSYKIKLSQAKKQTYFQINATKDVAQYQERFKQNYNLNRQYLKQQNKNERIEEKDKEIQRLHLKIRSLEHEKQCLEKQKSQTINGDIPQLKAFTNEKGTQLLQLDEANKTINRLVSILKTTPQSKLIANFIEQNKGSHFLKNISQRLKNGQISHCQSFRCCCLDKQIDERFMWTSTSAYKVMLQMKIKYDDLSEDCIQQVLFQLNRLRLTSQQSRVKRVKQYYQGEMNKIKKKFEEGYDQVLAKKQITRLKKQLKGKSLIKQKGKNLCQLKTLGQCEDQLKLKTKQIKLLQERIKLIQVQNGDFERNLYYQGALWIVDKALKQISANQHALKTFEEQFRNKMAENFEVDDWLKCYKLFFESLTDMNNSFTDKLMSLRQNAYMKMGRHP